ncbi:uncharacterized protein EV154DRAFT_503005 [Mucor mucedo]|uniref:uncharacterized protein n=1 Tax=Mucor mucedo TaxID=29922 RepID=UPI00221F6CBC|nr:uncharacterized protein EV154DRAFT_503005 [Mucor mucedo]KAI7893016.1 hypothetical protein EV154DRAFT_503005 [Mucor mucedo]
MKPIKENSIISSAPNSRPSSRPSSRPVSPTGSNYMNNTESNPLDEQVIPTAIVIKNIPFSVKKDALLSKLTSLDVPAAYAFNYHFDNGVFRGLAFANYRTAEETEIVVNTINGLEIGGRKLRVEYKKMLPTASNSSNLSEYINKREIIPHPSSSTSSQPSSPLISSASTSERRLTSNPDEDTLDLNDPAVLELYSFLLLFRGDPNANEIALPKTLSAKERRDAHLIADRLGLAHYSDGFGSERQVLIEKRGTTPAPIVRLQHKNSRGTLRSSPSRDRLNANTNNSGDNKRDSYRKSMMSTSTTAELATASNTIHPIRQPRGPEPGKNFASRQNNIGDALSEALARQHITHVGA